jgi:sulfatase modifying factor 1
MISVRGVTRAAVVAVVCVFLVSAAAAAAVDIQTVPVGNLGNAGEWSGQSYGGFGPDRICGSVAYSYNIGKYEVTAGQYKEFLNAVAKTDTYGLYNTNMSDTSDGSGIAQSDSSGNYAYSVDPAFVNRPVNYVSWGDSARFANWLTNGQGNGSTETGAYFLNGAVNDADLLAVTRIADGDRTPGKKYYFIPTEDEWYKAAYHKNDGVTGNYWDYPTGSDTAPGRDMADASGNNANIYGTPYPIDSGKDTTVAGEFENSASPYGTFDQGGNVWEWNEAILGSHRGLRGGSFHYDGSFLLAAYRNYYFDPSNEGFTIGFRVSEVPEPATMGLLALGGLMALRRRRL